MKKTLIAMAAVAATSAAFAQSSVSVYGIADIWVGSMTVKKDGTKETTTLVESGGAASSRIGFKGAEDLGGGLKAIFTVETGFKTDAPAATSLGDRTAFVGLSGGFGEVQVGRVWTAMDDVWAFSNNAFDTAFTARPSLGYSSNPNNGIRYTSPEFSGVTFAVSHALGEDKSSSNKAGSVTSLSLKYENGPLAVAFANQAEKVGAAVSDATNKLNLSANAWLNDEDSVEAAAGDKYTVNMLAATYDLGVVKLLANVTNGTVKLANGSKDKSSEYSVGVDVPLNAQLSVALGYGSLSFKDNGVKSFKQNQTSVAATYTLSKRTMVYAGYSTGKGKDLDDNTQSKLSGYAVGVNHKF